jgi:hypothetical protein
MIVPTGDHPMHPFVIEAQGALDVNLESESFERAPACSLKRSR